MREKRRIRDEELPHWLTGGMCGRERLDPVGELATWIIWHDWTEEELKERLRDFREEVTG